MDKDKVDTTTGPGPVAGESNARAVRRDPPVTAAGQADQAPPATQDPPKAKAKAKKKTK